jgi:hypothetical protein
VRDPEQQVLGQLLARPGPNHRRRSPSSLGWIEEDGGRCGSLRTANANTPTWPLNLVEGVCGRVAAVIAPDDYITLVRLLERLVAALI